MKHHLRDRHDTADQVVPPPVPKKLSGDSKNENPRFVRYYLLTYNTLSALGWSFVLILTLAHLFNLYPRASSSSSSSSSTLIAGARTATSSILTRILSSLRLGYAASPKFRSRIPPFLQPFYHRATTTYARVGALTAFVQTAALLEVLHVLLGWVRSPLPTTVMQVSSRLFLVWGVTEQFEAARVNPLYASMVVAWSTTEVIRYSFYACMLAGYEPRFLLYLRYTTFYVLYPLGASSEAFVIYATLPRSAPVPSWVQGTWKPTDYVRALLFVIWWPGLYVLYTHMIQLRRKVFQNNSSRTLGSKPKSKLM